MLIICKNSIPRKKRGNLLCPWPPCWCGRLASWQVLVVPSEEHTTELCGVSSWQQLGPSVPPPTRGCLQKRSKLGLTGLQLRKNTHTPVAAMQVTSVLCEISFLLLMLWQVGSLLCASRLGDANSHMMPFQSCVDVGMEENTKTFYPLQKTGHLQHTKINSCNTFLHVVLCMLLRQSSDNILVFLTSSMCIYFINSLDIEEFPLDGFYNSKMQISL